VYCELCCGVGCEEGLELRIALQMIVKFEGNAGGLVERTLDSDDIVYLWLKCFKDHVELPAAAGAFVDHELDVGLVGTEWLESHRKF
jgi:hypothetical protein